MMNRLIIQEIKLEGLNMQILNINQINVY